MQVLGGLIKLPLSDSLPLPWWHRAPLGLLHKTTVFTSITESGNRPIGDLLISVLDPDNWNRMLRVSCRPTEGPGILNKKFKTISPLNIALAETVTLESGKYHEINIICEPFTGSRKKDYFNEMRKRLDDAGFTDTLVERQLPLPNLVSTQVHQVNHGWVNDTNWRELVEEHFSDDEISQVDLSRGVVSADTQLRLLRYVFPRHGAKTVQIEHADVPGALKELTSALVSSGMNLLSALLRRGGAHPRNAMLVAVCEPHQITDSPEREIERRIRDEIKKLHRRFRANVKIGNGRPGSETIDTHHPEHLIARVPDDLMPKVVEYKSSLPHGKHPIFFSRRFFRNNPHTKKVERVIRRVMKNNSCHVVEAEQNAAGRVIANEVLSRLWISKAGIVVVMRPPKDDSVTEAFSVNLAHEFGVLQGQGKPALLLVDVACVEEIQKWSNMHGVIFLPFDPEQPLEDRDDPSCLANILHGWIDLLRLQ